MMHEQKELAAGELPHGAGPMATDIGSKQIGSTQAGSSQADSQKTGSPQMGSLKSTWQRFGSLPIERRVFVTMFALIAVYLMFSPVWAPDLTLLRYNNTRFLQIGLLLLLYAVLFVPSATREIIATWRSLGRWPHILIAILLIGGTVSTLFSAHLGLGALEIGLVTQLIFLFVCVAAGTRLLGRPIDTAFSLAILAGAGIFVLQFCVIQAIYLAEGKAFPWISPFLEFANVRFFSQYQAYTLFVITLPLAICRLTITGRIFVYVVAANFWGLQWMVGGRAVWAGLVAAAIMVVLCAGRGKSRWLINQGCVILAGAAIFLAFTAFTQSTPAATPMPHQLSVIDRGWRSVNERAVMAMGAIDLTIKNPVVGVGPGQFGTHYSATRAAHPHNSALQLLSEYGLVAGTAGIVLLGALALFAVRIVRTDSVRRQAMDPVNVALGAALVAGLVDSLFSGNLTMPHSQMLLSILAGWLVGRNLAMKNPLPKRPLLRHADALVIVSCMTLTTFVMMIFAYEYLALMQEMTTWLPERMPHFWQNGRFSAW